MQYFARSANLNGDKETVQHHLLRTAQLCGEYAEAFRCKEAGRWMGLFHDFGKYSQAFQEVLNGKRTHVDHALPGAAFMAAKLCGKRMDNSPLWPMVVAVRSHHGAIQYDLSAEIRDWGSGMASSPDGSTYSIQKQTLAEALKVFGKEVGIPATLPRLPDQTETEIIRHHSQTMLLTRMLFSALTDADYSASAEHFMPEYLHKASIPSIDPRKAYEKLECYLSGLSQNSTADPEMNRLRQELYHTCKYAGRTYSSGLYTLTAPTGSGKTLAMLAFALQQMIWQNKKRIILVLPYLSIIEQNAAVYRNIIPDILEDHSQAERNEEFGRELSQRWDAPFVITTSVKFFESLFACTGPACRKLHFLAESVVLFDEAQSLPVQLAETTLAALSELVSTYHTAVVFSTATQPDFNQMPGVTWKPQELVRNPQEMFSKCRRVAVKWALSHPTALETVATEMADYPNACMIVNLRKHAQKVFEVLTQQCELDHVYLMTTDLCPAHRTKILKEVTQRLKKQEPCYLIATQCIEAGVDISFDVMYRALAPLESIIQAAGRCNRSDVRKRGKVTVFLPDEETLYPDDFYQEAANAVLTLATRHEIDINELAHIREYYEILYSNHQSREKRELIQAIREMDFQKVSKAYRLIESNQLQILVPCPGEEILFNQLAEEARQQGVTASWMRRAAPLTVHSYQRKAVLNSCEPLFIYTDSHRTKIECNWYILSNPSYYDYRKGLQLSVEFEGII